MGRLLSQNRQFLKEATWLMNEKLSLQSSTAVWDDVRLRQIFRATLIRNSKNLLVKKYSDNNIVKVKSVFLENCTKKIK